MNRAAVKSSCARWDKRVLEGRRDRSGAVRMRRAGWRVGQSTEGKKRRCDAV